MKNHHEYEAMASSLDAEIARKRDLMFHDGPAPARSPEMNAPAVEESARDAHRNVPRPHEDCLYGLVGDVARTACKANREVNPYAAALAYMTALCAGLGRGCYLSIGDDWHHPRIFALHVGRSGRGRKGTSTKLVTRIMRSLKERHEDVFASKPHINLLGHITPAEMLDLMKARELSNGFANRFIMIWAEQAGLDPFPGYTTSEEVEALADRTADVLRFAQADRFVDRDHSRMQLSPEARERYSSLYRDALQDGASSDRVAGLLIRRAPYLLRLAMLFGLSAQRSPQ